MEKYTEKIVIIGSGVVGIHAATKLLDGGYPGELITIIDAGKDPYKRPETELMKGFAGCGMKSDGKYTRSTSVGGQLEKYCGEDKAYQLMDETIEMLKRFHPQPDQIIKSEPIEEPDFIKPYFNLRLFPVWHVGTDFLDQTSKIWYNWLVSKKINFMFDTEVKGIKFEYNIIDYYQSNVILEGRTKGSRQGQINYDKLIYATGKSGIDLTQKLIKKYNLKTESKSAQIGVRFQVSQDYFKNLVDLAYDFKLYQKPNNKVSLRTFCTNNACAYVAEEITYEMKSFNGHATRNMDDFNNMTNFGIIMEIKDIENPFEWTKKLVENCQIDGKGLYYSPNKTLKPGLTLEKNSFNVVELDNLNIFKDNYGEYADYIINFIDDMNKVFKFKDNYGIFIPEIKYLSDEILVNYNDLSLIDYPNVHIAGDSLSARGIVVSASHGLLISSRLLENL